MTLLEISLREAGLLILILFSCDIFSFLTWAVLQTLLLLLNYSPPSLLTLLPLSPAKEVVLALWRLVVELVLMSSLFLGPALGPQDLGLLGTQHLGAGGREGWREGEGGGGGGGGWQGEGGKWENYLQAMAFTRFSPCSVPRAWLDWF